MTTKSKYNNPETPIELTDEMRALLSRFTEEEIESGVVKTGHPAARGTHSAQDVEDAYHDAILQETIGGMIRTMRELHELSLRGAAENLGVSRGRAHQLEQTDANLRIDTLQRIAGVYGYKVQVTLVPIDTSKQLITAELPDQQTENTQTP